MSDVIDIDAHRPHWAGTASCIDCQHEWLGVRYSRREVGLIRALESITTGSAPNEGPAVNLDVARQIASDALKSAEWPPQ